VWPLAVENIVLTPKSDGDKKSVVKLTDQQHLIGMPKWSST